METLSTSECWSRLRSTKVGRLALPTADDDIDIFPVNHVVDGGSIVFRTAEGTKLSSVVKGQRSAFEVDGVDDDGRAWSVVVKGDARMIARRDELIGIFDLDVEPWHAGEKPSFVRLTPTAVSGRIFHIRPEVDPTPDSTP